MKNITRILTLLLCFCCTTHATANEAQAKIDTLTNLIKTMAPTDTARLAPLRELAHIKQNTPEGLELAMQLTNESTRLKVNKYAVFGGYYTTIYYYNRQVADSVYHYSQWVAPLAEQEQIWVVYFDVLKLRVNTYSLDEQFETAINEGREMHEKAQKLNYADGIISANMSMAVAYSTSDRLEESIKCLTEAYDMIAKANNPAAGFDVLGSLVMTCYELKNFDDMHRYLNEFKEILNKYIITFPFPEAFSSHYAFIELHTAYYYLGQNRPEEAFVHLKAAEKLLEVNGHYMYKLSLEEAYSDYYCLKKDYKKALEHLDVEIVGLKELMPKEYYGQLVKRGDLLMELNEVDKALQLYQESLVSKDSLAHATSNKQLERMKQIHNVNQVMLEKERIKTSRQRTLLYVIVITIAMGLTFIARTFFVRKKLKEAEQSMRQATELANETNEIKNRFLSNMSYNIRTPLNSVVGFSQLMSDDPEMDESIRKEYAAIIKKNSEELMNLVNNVLDLSRLEAGMMKFNTGKSDVSALMQDLQYMAKTKNEGKITVVLDNQTENKEIETDTARFMHLLLSLVSYPTECDENRSITVIATEDEKENLVVFQFVNTPLADAEFSGQEAGIRNEINRLFIQHFKGTYRVNPDGAPPCTVVFTYPTCIS